MRAIIALTMLLAATGSARAAEINVMLTDALARTHADTIALIDEAFAFASALPAKKKSGNASSPSKRKR